MDTGSQLSTQHSQWYRNPVGEPSSQTSNQQSLCTKITQNIRLLDLKREELELFHKSWTSETLMRFVSEAEKQAERKVHGKIYEKSRNFLYAFSGLAAQICGIAQAAAGQTEYSAAFAAVAVVLKVFHTRTEIEERIIGEINQLRGILPTVGYLKSAVHNVHMSEAISGICTEIANYLYEVIAYFKKPRLKKFAGALISNFDDKFGKHVSAIKMHTATIVNLQGTANLAASLDTSEKLDMTTRILLDMSARLEETRTATFKHLQFTAKLQAQSLHAALLPERYDALEIASYIDSQQSRLPPQERWENRDFSDSVLSWLATERRPLLWISGKKRKDRMSFLSPFTVDLTSALALESGVGLAYVFCDTDADAYPTSDFVVRYLVGQLLKAHPQVAVEHVDSLSVERCRGVEQSFDLAFVLLTDVLSWIIAAPYRPANGLFLIIDRIDLVQDSKNCKAASDFIPALQRLASQFQELNVVVTSIVPATMVKALNLDEKYLTSVEVGPPGAVRMSLE